MRRWLIAAAVLASGAASAGRSESGPLRVTAVRHWSFEGVTRVAVEVSGEFRFHSERLHNPERVFFDIFRASPSFNGKRAWRSEIDDPLVNRLRVAETLPGITRIVLDLTGAVEYTASRMSNPDRLVIELRPAGPAAPPAPEPAPVTAVPEAKPVPQPLEVPEAQPAAPAAAPVLPPPPAMGSSAPAASKPPSVAAALPLAARPSSAAPSPASKANPAPDRTTEAKPPSVAAAAPPPASKVAPAPDRAAASTRTAEAKPPAAPPPASKVAPAPDSATAATRTTDGKSSLIRALGLKINRVVIDPGHGGHDQGTVGRRGLMEKELVLDVARRLGQLIEQQIGCEVLYTRTDDIFIPLEGRTAFANEKHADLFISLHANSSRLPRIAGVETFYLNFTTSRDALDVASRENASSQKSISELQDLLQKIARQEKIEESKELAGRMQTALFTFSARYNPGIRNRGVKKAPFVVLVGAQMPSVLVEIGFLSNSREETLLKRPDHRQKVAEALLRGVFRYTQSLSHFQMAASPAALARSAGGSK